MKRIVVLIDGTDEEGTTGDTNVAKRICGEIHNSGIPWLRFIRQQLGARVHFWPFDGWDIPAGRSAFAEAYPPLRSRS